MRREIYIYTYIFLWQFLYLYFEYKWKWFSVRFKIQYAKKEMINIHIRIITLNKSSSDSMEVIHKWFQFVHN